VTLLKAGGFRFVIFTDDHAPAHVNVFGSSQAKVDLTGSGGGVELVWIDGMKAKDLRRALAMVQENREYLLEKWRQLHG
jgi:hypothetical protein